MPKTIVADSSCLILFYKIGELELLKKVFGRIVITETVSREFNKPLPEWIEVVEPKSELYFGLQSILDLGEASSIALASENKETLLIIDELKGRRVARKLDISITGSLGVLVVAKNRGYIKTVKPIIDKIVSTNFRISDDLVQRILTRVNEL